MAGGNSPRSKPRSKQTTLTSGLTLEFRAKQNHNGLNVSNILKQEFTCSELLYYKKPNMFYFFLIYPRMILHYTITITVEGLKDNSVVAR